MLLKKTRSKPNHAYHFETAVLNDVRTKRAKYLAQDPTIFGHYATEVQGC